MNLSSLKPAKGSVKANTRLGRGQGSGGGGTAKRGSNGAKSRSGYSQKRGFEGGQMPLQRRVPKFGFKNINRVEYKAINLDAIQALIDKTGAKIIDLGLLYNNGLMAKGDLVKILNRGELTSAVEVKVNAFSGTAKDAIEKAGGSAVVDTTFDPTGTANLKVEKTVKVEKVVAPKAVKVAPIVGEVAPVIETVSEVTAVELTPIVDVVAEVAPVVEKVAPAVEAVAEVPAIEVVAETIVEKPKKSKKTESAGDDLKLIEGIGPKIAELLNNAGIVTFADLATADVEKVKAILEEAGPRYNIHNPTTWGEQAALARDGKMEELKELQDKLNGGKAE
jgi:large subunit ribosomal protein L15